MRTRSLVALLLLMLLIVSEVFSQSSKLKKTSVAKKEEAPNSLGWTRTVRIDRMTGDSTVVYGRQANNDVTARSLSFKPILYLLCQPQTGITILVQTGLAVKQDQAGGYSVRTKVDADSPHRALWEALDNDGLFLGPSRGGYEVEFLHRLRGAKQLLFEFLPLGARAQIAEFDITGTDSVVDGIQAFCLSNNSVVSASKVQSTAKPTMDESLVDMPVMADSESVAPRYPDILKSAGVEGKVIAQFVVDTSGRAVLSSLRVLMASHDLFASAVRSALPSMRFIPARIGGKRVEQVVQWPFVFGVPK